MIPFSEKELFCLARHMIAQHYEETYPLTYISLYSDGLERYKRRKKHGETTTEETEKAKKEYHFLQQSKREYQTIHNAFRGNNTGILFGMPYRGLDCCEDCPNKEACVKVSDEEYDDTGILGTRSFNSAIIKEIREKLKPFIKANLERLNLTDFDDWGVIDDEL